MICWLGYHVFYSDTNRCLRLNSDCIKSSFYQMLTVFRTDSPGEAWLLSICSFCFTYSFSKKEHRILKCMFCGISKFFVINTVN